MPDVLPLLIILLSNNNSSSKIINLENSNSFSNGRDRGSLCLKKFFPICSIRTCEKAIIASRRQF